MYYEAHTKRVNEPDANSDDLSYEEFDIQIIKTESSKHVVTLSKYVESDFVYAKLLSSLRDLPHTATSVELRLSNFGGDCHQCVELFNAFKQCSIPVDVIITAPSYSCGAILALCGRSLTLNEGAFLMYHNYSTTERGKGGEVVQAVSNWDDYFHTWLGIIAHPFLSRKELTRLRNDGDVYIRWYDSDLNKRIKRHFGSSK